MGDGEGVLDQPISGRSARSFWKALRSSRILDARCCSSVTELELKPHTGRKHQLRIHCARGLGCPIVGDNLYGGCLGNSDWGLFLAAVGVELDHPITGEPLSVHIASPE